MRYRQSITGPKARPTKIPSRMDMGSITNPQILNFSTKSQLQTSWTTSRGEGSKAAWLRTCNAQPARPPDAPASARGRMRLDPLVQLQNQLMNMNEQSSKTNQTNISEQKLNTHEVEHWHVHVFKQTTHHQIYSKTQEKCVIQNSNTTAFKALNTF